MGVWEEYPDDEMLPFERVAEYLGVDPGSVRMFQRIGVLEFAYGCSEWMIERERLDEFVAQYGDPRRAATDLDPRRGWISEAPRRRTTDH